MARPLYPTVSDYMTDNLIRAQGLHYDPENGVLGVHVKCPLGASADWQAKMRDELEILLSRAAFPLLEYLIIVSTSPSIAHFDSRRTVRLDLGSSVL